MSDHQVSSDHEIQIPIGNALISGILHVPQEVKGIIIFAHGSGSGRLSPRNKLTADYLNQHHFATLLFDLLTTDEDIIDQQTREYRFNIPLLARRLMHVTEWVNEQPDLIDLPIAYFGASTGAGAALLAQASLAEELKEKIVAIVSRGGRPDLADAALSNVTSPTLLLVGELDLQVIQLNKKACEVLRCEKKLMIVPGASHLFEEPGKLEIVTRLTAGWFEKFV